MNTGKEYTSDLKEQQCLNAFNNLLHDDKIEFLARMEQRYEDYSYEERRRCITLQRTGYSVTLESFHSYNF